MNRKGAVAGSGVLFFVFFLMLVMIGGGIAGGIFAFYGEDYDFREAEAELLFDKARECFLENDFFASDFDIYSACRFNKNIDERHLIYLRNLETEEEFFVGVLDYRNQCFFDAAQDNENIPLCARQTTITKGGTEFEILVGSGQRSRKVLI